MPEGLIVRNQSGKISIADFRVWQDKCCQDAYDKGLAPEDMLQVLLEKAKGINVRGMQLKVAIVYMDKAKEILKEIIEDNALREWKDE